MAQPNFWLQNDGLGLSLVNYNLKIRFLKYLKNGAAVAKLKILYVAAGLAVSRVNI